MLCVQLGNGARASGVCCVAIGDGAVARGAFQVEVRSTLSFPTDLKVEAIDHLTSQLQDIVLTYQAMEDQKFAPEGFGARCKAAVDIAIDLFARHRATLVDALVEGDAKGKEEADSVPSVVPTTTTESQ